MTEKLPLDSDDPYLIDWANPDYKTVFEFRTENLERLRANPKALKRMKDYYKDHWADFINDWVLTYDPRLVNTGKSPLLPMILFPRQIDFVDFVHTRFVQRERGLGEKSRDVGFSWLAASCAVCIWLFYPHANIGMGSRKKELVDNGNADRKSLFWKIRFIIENLPIEFIPTNYGKENKWGIVYNGDTNSTISGEIGDNIGMGDRTSIYFVDEADALEHPQAAEIALSATTDCRIDISATYNVGSVFYNNKRSLPTEQVFEFDWTDDPRKRLNPDIPAEQEPWYQKQLRELDATVIASQIDRNPNASLANTFVDGALITEAENQSVRDINMPPEVPWVIGVDASGMGNDETVLWRRRGRISLPPIAFKKHDGIQLAARIIKEGKELLRTGPLGLIGIERDGPGGSAADQLKYSIFSSITVAVHTGIKLKDGRHYNFRAWLHTQALDYLKEEAPYIPKCPVFKTQATGILKDSKGGMLLMESKDDYRRRLSGAVTRAMKMNSRSPDHWDAFVLTFIPSRAKPIRQAQGDNEFFPGRRASNWRAQDAIMGY